MSRDNWFFLALAVFVWAMIMAVVLHGQPPPPPGGGFTASGTIIVMVNGIPVASGGVINIKSGDGVIAHATPDPTLGGTDISFDADTAVVASRSYLQSAPLTVMASSGQQGNPSVPPGGLYYFGNLNPGLQAYTNGAPFVFIPDVPPLTGATLNLGDLGPIAIRGTCGQACWVVYLPATSSAPAAFLVI